MTIRRGHILLTVVVLSLVLVSCQRRAVQDENIASSSAELIASPEPEPLQACDLVDRATVESIVSASLLEPKQSTIYSDGETLSQGCLFLAADNAFTPTVQVDLQSPIKGSLVEQWTAVQSSAAARPRYKALTIPIVDQAYQNDRGVVFLKDGYGVSVTISMPESAANQPAALKVAEAIATAWDATAAAIRRSE